MNHAKIAAALHALAEAFEGVVEDVEAAVGKKSGKKSAPSAPSAPPSTAAPAPVAAAVTAAATAPAAASEPTPAAPSITIEQLNKAVLKVAAKNRDGAVAILGKFGLTNTVGLAPEKYQPLFDAFEEEIAKMDAAAVQVQQASLV
jgi:pilus assembly protein FimV